MLQQLMSERDESQHTDRCQNAYRAWLTEFLLYQEQWPNYCHDCDGWGWTYSEGNLKYVKLCHCVNDKTCPRCGKHNLTDELHCPDCDWNYQYPGCDGIPPKYSCTCLEHGIEKYL